MEIDDKEASRIHGIISSDSDSDYNSREFDEDYNSLKPPPLDYNLIKDKIVVISREQVVNVWEKRLKNLEKNNLEGIRAAHVTLATKKKKKKLKVNAFDDFPKLKKGVKNDVKIEQPKKKLKENAQNQAFNSLSSKNSCTHAGPSKTKKKEVANVDSPKICYDIDTLKKVEEKISGLKNVWHSGLSNTIIQEELILQRQKESSMYECWMKSASIEDKSKETIKEEDKTVKNKGKTKMKSKQPVGKSPSTNVAKDAKDIKKDISNKKEKQTIKNCKGNGPQSSNLTFLDKGTVDYAWQWYNTFPNDVENDTVFTNEVTTANTTVKTKKKTRSKKKSKQSVDKMVNLSPMNESRNSEDKSVDNMTKKLKDKAKSKTDFNEVLETSPDGEKWNMQLLNKENTKKVIPKNKEKQIIKYSKEIGTQNMNLTFLDEETVKRVWYWQQFGFYKDIESSPIFTNETTEANTTTKKTRKKKKSKQSVDILVNPSSMKELHNTEHDSIKNMTTQLEDEAKVKTDFEEVLETSLDEEKWNMQLLDKEMTEKGIPKSEKKQIIKDPEEIGSQDLNFTLLDQKKLNDVLHLGNFFNDIQQFKGFSNDTENDPIFTNETLKANTTTKTKKRTRSKRKSKQSMDKLANQSLMNELHNSEDDSVESMTTLLKDEAKEKTDFEEVLETSPDEETWNIQLQMNLMLLDEEILKRVWYWQYFKGFSNDIESGPIFTKETTERNTTMKTRLKNKLKQSVDKLVNQNLINELDNNENDLVENVSTELKEEAKAETDFEEVSETSPDEETWNIQLLDKENAKKEIPKNKEMQIIKESKENSSQNVNLMLLDQELVKRVWYWQYFDGFSNDIECGPIFIHEMTEANTITKTKKKTTIENKSEQLMDKLVNQSTMNQLHNSEDDSVKNVTTLLKDEAKVKTDFAEVWETSRDEETWNIQQLDKENTKKEIPKNKEMEIIKESEENGTQNMNLMFLDEEIVKRVWYWQYFDGFSNDIECGPIFTKETTEANTTTETKKKTRSKKKSKQSVKKVVNQSSMNESHNSEDDSVENVTTQFDEAKTETGFEVLKMSPHEEKWNMQLLDNENTKKLIPKNEEKQIVKNCKQNDTQDLNLTLLHQEKGIFHSGNFFNEIQQFKGVSNDTEKDPTFTNEMTKVNTTIKTKKKTKSKKKTKQSVDKLVNQSPMSKLHNSKPNLIDNMAKQDKNKYADSKETLKASYSEQTCNPQFHKKILAPAWFLSPGDTKIQSVGKIQGEIGNHSTIKDTKQINITSTIVGKPKTKKKKKSKQSTAAPLLNKVGQGNEKTNEDRVKLEKQHRENSTDSLQHQQTTQKSLDLNSAVQENVSIENNPKYMETFDNTATLKNPQYVFDEGFKDFIQDIFCENAGVPDLNGFNYEQLQRPYTAYQEKKNTSKQQNAVPYNVATKNDTKENNIFWPSYGNRNTNPNSGSVSTPVLTYPTKTNINSTTKLSQEHQATEAKLEVTNRRSNVAVTRSFVNFSTETVNFTFNSKDETKSSELHDRLNKFEEKQPVNDSATSRAYDNTPNDFHQSFGSFTRIHNDAMGFDAISTSKTDQYGNIYRMMYDGRNENSSDDVKKTMNDSSFTGDRKGLFRHLGSSNDDLKSNSNVISTYNTSSLAAPYRHDMKNTDYRQSIVHDQNTKEVPFSWKNENYYDRSSRYVENYMEKPRLGQNADGYMFEDRNRSSASFGNRTSYFDASDETKSRELREYVFQFGEKQPVNSSATISKVNSAKRDCDNTPRNFDESFEIFTRIYNDAIGFDAISTSNVDQYRNIYRVMYDSRNKNSSDDVKKRMNDRTFTEDGKGLLPHLGSSNHDLESNPNVSRYGTSSSVARYRHDMRNTDYGDSIVSHQSTKKIPTFSWENEHYYDHSSRFVENYAEEQHLGQNGHQYLFEDRNRPSASFGNRTSYLDASNSLAYRDNEKDTLIFVLLHIFFTGIVAILVASIIMNVVSILYDNIFFVGLIIFICMKFKS